MTVPPRFPPRMLPRDLAVCVAAGCGHRTGRVRREASASCRRRDSRYCTIGNLRVGIEKQTGQWLVRGFGRLNNFTNVNYVGSVIVGDTNGRYFEPAATRNFLVGFIVNASF